VYYFSITLQKYNNSIYQPSVLPFFYQYLSFIYHSATYDLFSIIFTKKNCKIERHRPLFRPISSLLPARQHHRGAQRRLRCVPERPLLHHNHSPIALQRSLRCVAMGPPLQSVGRKPFGKNRANRCVANTYKPCSKLRNFGQKYFS